ncbi:MAG TPA: ATP-binding protein, partial [Candidatus Cryosericum sp.]|nr:ATP-binding protein [Candidatus Cryosericum sp.]
MTKDSLDSYYARIRAEEREALERRINGAYSRSPRLKELDEARSKLFTDLGARRISTQEAKQRLENIANEERDILVSIGLPEDALKLHVRCELCNDTGYVGLNNRPCACRLLRREKLRGPDGINERETFSKFSTDIYPTAEQKRRALNAKSICEAYAKSLPKPVKPNILLIGMPGLGKSFLCNAIAYESIKRGIDVEYVTAYSFIQNILSDIKEETQNALRYQSCPLLILDDLGSEPNIPNVSFEWLFAVINERTIAGRATVCSSNCTLKQLSEIYDERFMSR